MTATPVLTPGPTTVREALAGVRSVYQPVVDLADGAVVGYEALARGPAASPWERPDRLFAAAAAHGWVAELDWCCRTAALRGAADAGLTAPATVFVNVEPAALGTPAPPAFDREVARLGGRLPVVVEFTERALADDPARLLAAVDWVRGQGWGVAVDDIGAVRSSLALMPFLAPDVLKLDLRLVQQRTTVEVAEVVTAVNAQAERTGALILAEGIETPAHRDLARAMGARLGQGWLLGRPAARPAPPSATGWALPLRPTSTWSRASTPYDVVLGSRQPQRATKPLLLAMTRLLEQQAAALQGPVVVLATFEQARHVTPATRRRYAALARHADLVVGFAEGLAGAPAPGAVGVDLDPADPVAKEWDVVVVGPHFAAALIARDVGDTGAEEQRRFDHVLTYDRDLVLAAATALLRRVGTTAERGAQPTPTAR